MPCFPELPGTWINLNIHEYSSSVPGENSSMDLNLNYFSKQTWTIMNYILIEWFYIFVKDQMTKFNYLSVIVVYW